MVDGCVWLCGWTGQELLFLWLDYGIVLTNSSTATSIMS
jgi:hypothetical protein